MKQLTKAELLAEVARLNGQNNLLHLFLHRKVNGGAPARVIARGAYRVFLFGHNDAHGGFLVIEYRSREAVQDVQGSVVYLDDASAKIRDHYSEDQDYRDYSDLIRELYNWRMHEFEKERTAKSQALLAAGPAL